MNVLSKILMAGVAVTFCGAAVAAPVAITNGSFDDDVLAGDWSNVDPTGWVGDDVAPGDGVAVFLEQNSAVAGTLDGGDGANYAGIDAGASLTQDLAASYQAGMTYTLTVAIGDRSSQNSSDATVIELAQTDGTVLASLTVNADNGVEVPEGQFADFALNYNATGAEGNIRVILRDGQGAERGHFDNVRLDAAPIPEPGSLALLGLGGLALLRRRK